MFRWKDNIKDNLTHHIEKHIFGINGENAKLGRWEKAKWENLLNSNPTTKSYEYLIKDYSEKLKKNNQESSELYSVYEKISQDLLSPFSYSKLGINIAYNKDEEKYYLESYNFSDDNNLTTCLQFVKGADESEKYQIATCFIRRYPEDILIPAAQCTKKILSEKYNFDEKLIKKIENWTKTFKLWKFEHDSESLKLSYANYLYVGFKNYCDASSNETFKILNNLLYRLGLCAGHKQHKYVYNEKIEHIADEDALAILKDKNITSCEMNDILFRLLLSKCNQEKPKIICLDNIKFSNNFDLLISEYIDLINNIVLQKEF